MSKNFNDFISSIDAKTIDDFLGEEKNIKFSLTNDGLQDYTNSIIAKSFSLTVNLLEAYHNWLNS